MAPREINLCYHAIVKLVGESHNVAMAWEPARELSAELEALINRAELASARARLLIDENDRWRQSIRQQLDCMFELGGEVRRSLRVPYS
jgi:hypothetical protein